MFVHFAAVIFLTTSEESNDVISSLLSMAEKYKYRVDIQQMMFVSGATTDPPVQTICLVEDIVKSQVVELIMRGGALVRKRGTRTLTVEDIMFLIRHDTAKLSRLCNYLSWKEVRGKHGEAADPSADLFDAEAAPELGAPDPKKQSLKNGIALPWKPQYTFSISMVGIDPANPDFAQDSDDEDLEVSRAMNERLKAADLRTRNMTREEYVHWAECRQASFTFRKGKRFRDWCGMSQISDVRLGDDVLDVLGFLTFEMVANVTERALKIKSRWTSSHRAQTTEQRRNPHSLFSWPGMQDSPLQPEHVRLAYAEFEEPSPKNRAMRAFTPGHVSYAVNLI